MASPLRRPPFTCAAILALTRPALAHACTVCDSPTGHSIRAGLFNGHFLHMVTLILLPFPILTALVLLLNAVMPEISRPNLHTSDTPPGPTGALHPEPLL